MRIIRRSGPPPRRLGILPGAFNPVTVAHGAMARSALGVVDEVLFVLPREFPHKPYSGASLEQRIELLLAAVPDSIGISDGGLFIEIARECREVYGPDPQLTFLTGRDAAERIIEWDYGDPGAVAAMLREFDLLVADRAGEYSAPDHLASAIRPLPLPQDFTAVSSTEVRERIARGEAWEHLVPAAIRDEVRRIYSWCK